MRIYGHQKILQYKAFQFHSNILYIPMSFILLETARDWNCANDSDSDWNSANDSDSDCNCANDSDSDWNCANDSDWNSTSDSDSG